MPQIKFLNKFVLAKLLKNFRWLFLFALIHELLNKSINLSKVFKFVFTLFNLQGTDISSASLSLAANLCILSQVISFVKNFFKVFVNFFVILLPPSRISSSATRLSYHKRFILSSTFFLNFEVLLIFNRRLAATCIY